MIIMAHTHPTASTTGWSQPRLLLHLEGVTMFLTALVLYWYSGGSWLLFALLLLAPDLAMSGYLINQRVGAPVYNIVHSYPLPAAFAIGGLWSGNALLLALGLIWFAHIGMDRALGYGLKYPTAFRDTHFNRV
jgi:multisubunit Na+/H+ antiporter MnhB subunit